MQLWYGALVLCTEPGLAEFILRIGLPPVDGVVDGSGGWPFHVLLEAGVSDLQKGQVAQATYQVGPYVWRLVA